MRHLGERYTGRGVFYLLGGSALLLLGSPRETLDVDYMADPTPEADAELRSVLDTLATELKLDLEFVPQGEFIPLPPQAHERRRLVGRYGQLEVYIFDLYSIALSKIARGFESDLEDVVFTLREGLIEFGELERLFNAILPDAPKADIDRAEFRAYFDEVRRRLVP
ncbi:MAG: hypothetical protein HY260_00100 [Chloroflexi bacterium]|nr:hypothetical protein [Chloroflexota bacterium]